MNKIILSALLIAILMGGVAGAVPTPVATTITWDDYTDPTGVGFFLYWSLESEPDPRVYDDTRKIDVLRPEPEMIVVIDAKPDSKGNLCFKLTAYSALGTESGFSGEACGYFGFSAATGFTVQ